MGVELQELWLTRERALEASQNSSRYTVIKKKKVGERELETKEKWLAVVRREGPHGHFIPQVE